MLGDRMVLTVEDRAVQCGLLLRKRYSKLLAMPDWTEEELSDIGHRLRGDIEAALAERDIIRGRIAKCHRKRS